MLSNSLAWYIFTFALFDSFIKTQLTFYDNNHGFINKNSQYFEEELSHIQEEISTLHYSNRDGLKRRHLRFEPDILDFDERSIGIPHLKTVTLFNDDYNKSIEMNSISGNTVHFHSSFFEDIKIPPKGNTSFKVVYLARNEGKVTSNLFIHTSKGFVRYDVRGFGLFSRYKIRPIVGVKVPLNATFTPFIYLHNPHPIPVQISEVQSSGGGFHLELLSGNSEAPNNLWEIQPQETKPVVRVKFEAKEVQNNTAYVQIKLNDPPEVIIVPLEVEVLPYVAPFHPQGYIDFGVGGNLDHPKEVEFCLFNPSKKPLRVHSVSTTSKSIKVQYYNIRINPGLELENSCVKIGSLTLDWRTAWNLQDYYGKIVVRYRNGRNRTEIPYHLSVLRGGISYDNMATTYFISDKAVDLSVRPFEIRNEFEYPLKIKNISFPPDTASLFKVDSFTPKVLQPDERQVIFNIRLRNSVKKTNAQMTSSVTLHTNISEMAIPIFSYNGKLHLHLPYKTDDYRLDIGLIGLNTKREAYFLLTNPNPVTLHITSVRSSLPMTQVEVHGCGEGDDHEVLSRSVFKNLFKCHSIRSNHYVVIKITITTTQIEGQIWGDVQVETPFEHLLIPVHFKISRGKLEIGSDRITFDQCFPGRICSHPLKIHSTFDEEMEIINIISIPADNRISASHLSTIYPRATKIVGRLFLDPDLECSPNCYTGLWPENSASWLKTLNLSKNVAEFDLHLVNVFYNRYLNLTSNAVKTWQNLTFLLDTTGVKGQKFKSRVKMIWPSLIEHASSRNKTYLDYPLTQTGNYSYRTLVLYNPASRNLLIHLVFHVDYFQSNMVFEGLPPRFLPETDEDIVSNRYFYFDKNLVSKQRKFFSGEYSINASEHTLPLLLLAGQAKEIKIGFFAEDSNVKTTFLFIRNNLTILEIVRLRAQGATPLFKLGNRKPGSMQPLLFEFTERHFKDCDKLQSVSDIYSNFTVKRTFTARNLGEISVHVTEFYINNFKCEGYGFRIVNCEPFLLPPNGTKKIDIEFTTDLTLARVTRTLILYTNLNYPVNYSLHTAIPSAYLNLCKDVNIRPPWELYLSYIFCMLMTTLFIGVVLMAVLDGERIRSQALEAFMSTGSPTLQPLLDLRKVGLQIREEIQSTNENKKQEYEDTNGDYNKSKVEPVLIPATSKSKRKLSHRNSCEGTEYTLEEEDKESKETKQRKRDAMYENHRLKLMERKSEKEMKIQEEKERREKHIQQLKEKEQLKKPQAKKLSKHLIVSSSIEEEASSTTTESSNNCEDNDKDNRKVKNTVKKVTIKSKENVKNESATKQVSFVSATFRQSKPVHKCERIKDSEKYSQEQEGNYIKYTEKGSSSHYFNNTSNRFKAHPRESKKREKQREKKEKLIYRNKNNDKKPKNCETEMTDRSKSPTNFYVPLPIPTATPLCWENKAKFSDVVARNDIATSSSCAKCPLQSCSGSSNKPKTGGKPTMYVEPYKASKPELGPIGSRRNDASPTDMIAQSKVPVFNDTRLIPEDKFNTNAVSPNSTVAVNDFVPLNDRSIIAAISGDTLLSGDSFFSNLHNAKVDSHNAEQINCLEENWNRQRAFRSLLENCSTADLHSGTAYRSDMEDPWNRHMLNSSDFWSSNVSLLEAPSNSNTSYLWGSNPVWQPWTPPESPGTPRRSPPGFDQVRNNLEGQAQREIRDGYNVFSGIWNQQNRPWDYDCQH